MDSIVAVNGPNRGLIKTDDFTVNSKDVHLLGPLHADMLFNERLLLNSVDLEN